MITKKYITLLLKGFSCDEAMSMPRHERFIMAKHKGSAGIKNLVLCVNSMSVSL